MRPIPFAAFLGFAVLPGLALAQTAPSPSQPPAWGITAPDSTLPGGGMPGHPGHHGWMAKWQAKFNAANTTHDGHLTLAQAQAAGLRFVAAHFSEIDTRHRGYVTFNDVQAWRLDKMAQRMQQKAAQLRAAD